MPKEKTDRWSVRNKRLRAENHFNMVMCEYITYKYGNIATECCEFYDQLMKKYPVKACKTYTGSKKFKKWVSDQIAVYCDENAQQGLQLLTDNEIENILQELKNGSVPLDTDEHTQQGLQLLTNDEIENILLGLKNGCVPLDTDEHAQQDLQLLADNEIENILQELENGGVPLDTDEHAQQDLPLDTDEHAQQDLQLLADNEIENILQELENGDAPLDTDNDEGIHLDLYEEIVDDISDLDLEVELGYGDDIFF